MASIRKYKVTEPYLDVSCKLGEAPFWDRTHNTLRFVDVQSKKAHFVDLNKGPSSHKEVSLKECMTITADIEGNDDEFVS